MHPRGLEPSKWAAKPTTLTWAGETHPMGRLSQTNRGCNLNVIQPLLFLFLVVLENITSVPKFLTSEAVYVRRKYVQT